MTFMKTYMIKTILLAAALFSSSMAHAFDFFALNEDGVIIYYNILNSREITCSVANHGPLGYSGDVRIPERVSYNSVEFTVVKIDKEAFYSCRELTSVEIPETVTIIGQNAFWGCSSLTSITIPSSVTTISNGAFGDCQSLTTITIPDGVTSIERSTFAYCYNLTSITIPDGVTNINESAFRDCNSLTSITIPDNVIRIENYAFQNCSSLTHVTIGKSVTNMGYQVFNGCTALTEVTSRIENPFAINNNCFPSRVKQSALLIVPKGTKAKYLSKRGWSNFYSIIEEGTGYYSLKLADNLQMFSYSENLDFSSCNSSLQVFVVCGFKPETSEVLLMRVTKVPAGTGVLLRGETGNYYPSLSDQSSSISSNFLVGSLTETSLTDGYILNGDAFVRVDAPTAIPANSAYLTLPASAQGAKRLTLKFMEESTGIDLVKDDMPQGDSHWYSLQGTRLNGTPTTPGIYFRNGRKVWVK